MTEPKSEVFNMDNMEFMRSCKDGQFDLAIVDPPYGIDASKGTWGCSNKGKVTNYGKKKWDKSKPPVEYFEQLFRISKNQIVWGANYFISLMPFDASCWIVWDKVNGDSNFADCELAWTSFDSSVRKFSYTWNGMIQENMKNKEIRIHPTQKPVALYTWLLQKYAKQGDSILDTHLGSGSSRIACWDMKFDFTGIELDKEYFDASVKRFNTHKSQLKMF